MSARIAAVEVFPLEARWGAIFGPDRVPAELRHPAAHFRAVPRRGQASLLVRVRGSDGGIGWGEGWGLPTPRAGAAVIADVLAPLVCDRSLADHAELIAQAEHALAAFGLDLGAHREALSALDLALWDLRARRSGRSMAEVFADDLGAEAAADRVVGYASPVRLHDDPAAAVAEAETLVAAGHRALKLKVGREPARDAADYRRLRAVLGPAVGIAVDVNGAWTSAQVVAFCDAIADDPPRWVEDPLPLTCRHELPALRRRIASPIATGENDFHPAAFARLLDAGAADLLVVNIGRVGGWTGLARIARLAAGRVELSLHGVGGAVLVGASVQAAAALGCQLECNRLCNPLRDALCARQPWRFEDGAFVREATIGLGCEPDAAELERWTTGHMASEGLRCTL